MTKRKTSTEIKKELRKLQDIFVGIDESRKKVVETLIENAAFMAAQLKLLQAYIDEHGVTETYQNGENQFGKKKSSEVDVYNTMIKNYTAIIRQLLELLPADQSAEEDELLGFLRR